VPVARRVRRRALHALGGARAAGGPADAPQAYDDWLTHVGGPVLQAIDETCGRRGPQDPSVLELFRGLDEDLWAMLLSQDYTCLPHIKAALPGVPEAALQELWNGASGPRLANQSKTFYAKVRDRYATHGAVPLADARVLDHGCGWGRLLRFFARDVTPGRLFGTDPTPMILDVCRRDRVPAQLHDIDVLPDGLPVGDIDLAYAFSVFTHTSEVATERALDALHAALVPGGILVVTVRPPAYLTLAPDFRPALDELGPGWSQELRGSRYLFVPHPAQDSHFQYYGDEMTYGESIITLPWIRERWAPRFELLEAAPLVGDLHQVVVTLRRSL
jgi:SAM-dependent methyltransferase